MRTGVSTQLFVQTAIVGSIVCYTQAAAAVGLTMLTGSFDNIALLFTLFLFLTAPFTGFLCALLYAAHDDPQHFADDTCRCRNCKYILRGLTEPRCPECGEEI